MYDIFRHFDANEVMEQQNMTFLQRIYVDLLCTLKNYGLSCYTELSHTRRSEITVLR